jgi:TM2 domain-containing membrane protein YozV
MAKSKVSKFSRTMLAIICFFLGSLGVHRFVVGKVGTGLLMLFTLGLFGVWTLIDFIVILAGQFEDKKGLEVKNW